MFFVNIVKQDAAAITYQEEGALVTALTSVRRRNIDPVDYPENLDSLVILQDGVLTINKKTAKKFGIVIKTT